MNPILKNILRLFGVQPSDLEKRDQRNAEEFSYAELLRNGLDPFTGFAQVSQDRTIKYNDFDLMDQYSDICTALDIYAEEASQVDSKKNRVVWIESDDKKIQEEGERWIRRIRLDERIYGLARNLAKYGDVFQYLLLNQEGIYQMQFIHPTRVTRLETDRLVGFQCDDLARLVMRNAGGGDDKFFMPWDFVHFKIEAYDRETIYGRSMIEGVRKIWKELQILETMVAIFRITKSVERNVFYIDMSDTSPQEAKALLQKWREHLRKQQFIDPATNDFRIDIAAITPQEDIIMPVRGETHTKIEKLTASPDIGAIEDLHYFRTKLRTALGIPKSYFDQELDATGWNSKEALILQDQRFSKKIQRLQRSLRGGLMRTFAIHLTLSGTPWSPGDFRIGMSPVNQITERLKEEWWLRRAALCDQLIPLAGTAGFDQKKWNKVIFPQILPIDPHVLKDLMDVEEPAAPQPGDPNANPAAKPGQPATTPGTVAKFSQFAPSALSGEDIEGLPPSIRQALTEAGLMDRVRVITEDLRQEKYDATALTEDIKKQADSLKESVARFKDVENRKLDSSMDALTVSEWEKLRTERLKEVQSGGRNPNAPALETLQKLNERKGR